MAYRLTCPCGETFYGREEADIVTSATAHLTDVHQRAYSPDEIMFMAITIPDRLLPEDA